jgi:hypothetical protein
MYVICCVIDSLMRINTDLPKVKCTIYQKWVVKTMEDAETVIYHVNAGDRCCQCLEDGKLKYCGKCHAVKYCVSSISGRLMSDGRFINTEPRLSKGTLDDS